MPIDRSSNDGVLLRDGYSSRRSLGRTWLCSIEAPMVAAFGSPIWGYVSARMTIEYCQEIYQLNMGSRRLRVQWRSQHSGSHPKQSHSNFPDLSSPHLVPTKVQMCQPVVGFEARRNRHTPCQPTRYPGPCLSSLLSYYSTPTSGQRDGTCPSWWKLTRLNFGEYAFFVAPFGSTLAQVFQRTQRREGCG